MEGHYRRAIQVLRYLFSTPGMGCVYKAKVPEFVVYTDSAFGLFRADGLSSSANIFCMGRNNAPFAASTKAQADVATCPMTAEYYAAGNACKAIMFFRQLSADLGWPLSSPTLLYADNKTMISLVTAPQVSTKSRHIEIVHHHIRQLSSRGLVRLQHVPASQMRADILTKILPR
eukprot:gene34582-44708_t